MLRVKFRKSSLAAHFKFAAKEVLPIIAHRIQISQTDDDSLS